MKKFKHCLLFCMGGLILLASCGDGKDTQEQKINEEQRLLDERLKSDKVLSYKGIKVLLRSADFNGDYDDLSGKSETGELSAYILDKAIKGKNSLKEISLKDGYHIIRSYSKLKTKLTESEEDDLPTLYDRVHAALCSIGGGELAHAFETDWNPSTEHFFIAVILSAIPGFTKDYALYESSYINPGQISDPEIKVAAAMFKTATLIGEEYNYLAEREMNNMISAFEKKEIRVGSAFDFITGGSGGNTESAHALCLFLRGIARINMDEGEKHKQAENDLEKFRKMSSSTESKLGILAMAYVYCSRGKYSEASEMISELEKKDMLTGKEKERFREISESLEKTGKLSLDNLKSLIDIPALVSESVYKGIRSTDYYRDFSKTETGQMFLEVPETILDGYKQINSYTDADSLYEKGKDLLDKIF